jgi:hypothetical protein
LSKNKNSEIDEVKFKLYPNPASDKVTIEFLNDDLELLDVKLNIYTITGSLVYSKEFITEYLYEEFSISNLNNGVYFYKIEFSNGNKKSGKLIILKE